MQHSNILHLLFQNFEGYHNKLLPLSVTVFLIVCPVCELEGNNNSYSEAYIEEVSSLKYVL